MVTIRCCRVKKREEKEIRTKMHFAAHNFRQIEFSSEVLDTCMYIVHNNDISDKIVI